MDDRELGLITKVSEFSGDTKMESNEISENDYIRI